MWHPQLSQTPVRYRSIVDALALDIAQGRLKAGDRLPPQRLLADRLGINLSTVSRAYQEAARRRLVGGEVGRGTFVLGSGLDEESLREVDRPAIDLSEALPAERPDDTDLADTLAGLSEAERRSSGRYATPERLEAARRAVRTWLASRGLSQPPEAVVLGTGARIVLIAVLVERCVPGDAILVERESFPGLHVIAGQLGLRLVPVEQDREGVLPDAFAMAARRSGARTAVLMPNLQNPTGSVMGTGRRVAIAEIASHHGLTVVEDDVYGSLSGRPPLMEEFRSRTILVSSLSKTVMPGLRFGFAAGPAALLKPLMKEVHPSLWGLAALPLLIGTRWIEDGTALRRDDWQRREVAARWSEFEAVFGCQERPPSPNAWLRVAGDVGAALRAAHEAGVAIAPASAFSVSRQPSRHVRISLTAADTRDTLRFALHRLRQIGVFG